MENVSLDARITSRVMRNIGFHARRLAQRAAKRGMEAGDYQQDLICDLLRRQKAFDPARASFFTFADRVVAHRSLELSRPSARKQFESGLISLDAAVDGPDGETADLIDLIADDGPPLDETIGIALDVRRFLGILPPPLLACCEVLLADSIAAGARQAGIHRSTVYERTARLRQTALVFGLDAYLSTASDTLPVSPVSGLQAALNCAEPSPEASEMTMRPRPRPSLLVDEKQLRKWLANASAGEVIEYHRGNLVIDRLAHGSRLGEQDRKELDRVADLLFTLARGGRGHLLQRRHGVGDYSYLFVLRGNSDRAASVSLRLAGEFRS